jgi:hypothetical protein
MDGISQDRTPDPGNLAIFNNELLALAKKYAAGE